MAATKISLDVNVPLTGTVKFVDFYPEKENPNQPGKTMAAQWALSGSWGWTSPDGNGQSNVEGKVYIDEYQLAASPVALGMVEQNGTWDDGNPRFKWTYKAAIRLLKTEEGRKRHVTISRLDGFAASTVAGAASPPLAVAAPVAQPAGPAPGRAPTGTPSPVPHTPEAAGWMAYCGLQVRLMSAAYRMAQAVHQEPGWSETTIVSDAHSFYIQLNRDNQRPPMEAPAVARHPDITIAPQHPAAHLGSWNQMPAAVAAGIAQDESDLPF